MRQFFKHLFQRTSHDLHQTIRLLSSSASSCPFCGKEAGAAPHSKRSANNSQLQTYLSYLPSSFAKSICSSCQAAIPWLTPIKCRICGRGITCTDCIRRSDAKFIANRSAVEYSSEMREWLAQYKYRGNEKLEQLLAEMMFPAFAALTKEALSRSGGSQAANPSYGWDAITFVPVSMERAEERGFNQAQRFASILASQYHIPLHDMLIRERHTEKQSFKTRPERMKDTRHLFQAKPEVIAGLSAASAAPYESSISKPHALPQPARSIRLLLIDDIYTTGSTIQACATALHQQSQIPLEIYALTWARS
ncbi:ComF family protein [Paenibacillus lupini]|uniref:ComF family protein n=1 Tax=Paenibacillus lupini TaxID=1450204 RepID=UPI001420E128|nr:ComF family protein [Paenibacillus lupini]NIK25630.1 putative amidophosphoribosyltransferase [Paenibacillus lupini]